MNKHDTIWIMRLRASRTLCDSDSNSALSHRRSCGRILSSARKSKHISSVSCKKKTKKKNINTTPGIARPAPGVLRNLARAALNLTWNLARGGSHLERNHRKMAAPPEEGSLESRISKSCTVVMKLLCIARLTRFNMYRHVFVPVKRRAFWLVDGGVYIRVRFISEKPGVLAR